MTSSSFSFSSLESLSLADRVLFNKFSKGPECPIPYDVAHHAFEAVALAHPDITAVRNYDGTTITYGELDRRANMLANELIQTYGLQIGERVVLVYSRCIEMVVFILAVLKAGGQYVPLDGGIVTDDTLGFDIADSNAPVVLCLPKFFDKVIRSIPSDRRDIVNVLDLDSTSAFWRMGNPTDPMVDVRTEDGAYVIYTSGTTGRPKGVDVRHRGVTNTLLAEPSKLGITIGRNVAQQLNVAFDMCAWEILGTMMNGGTLHIRGSGLEPWTDCLQRVDIVIATPSVVLKYMPNVADFPNVDTIAVGGEPCPLALAEKWAPHVNFWNVCGPTEISMLNTGHLHRPGIPLSIGKPNPNTNVYILDDDENPVPVGQPGVMWAGGPGVSAGYINLPELTATRYKLDKFTNDGNMMFNTGDLAQWLEDGSLLPLGRKDDQVKIQGFRVELDGVSRSIETTPGVIKGCALKIDDALWGFYSSHAKIDEAELKQAVSKGQPFYAVPKIWRHLPVLELTPNGKVDKRALYQIAKTPDTLEPEPLGLSIKPRPQTLWPSADRLMSMDSSSNGSLAEKYGTLGDLEKHSKSLSTDEEELLEDEYPLPEKNGFHGWRWLRHTAFSAYRKLFGFIFIVNLAVLIILLWASRDNNFFPSPSHLATAVASNLLCAVLIRQEYVVNAIFFVCSRVPTSFPLSIRRHFARVYHNGGVHSGCAISATTWWAMYSVSVSRDFLLAEDQPAIKCVVLALTYVILVLLIFILVMAYPTIRMKMHDQFEWAHRFIGWFSVALVWAHVVVSTAASTTGPLGPALGKSPTIYLLSLITLSIALPWARLRRVNVVPEPLSSHAVRLHFDFCTPGPCTSKGVRITDRPMIEWHAFAAIPEANGKGFSIIVSKAGDWTKRIIEKPPTSIWTRGTPASGVLAIAPLFKKVVLVATGSGIGPCMPVIMERRVPCHVVWSTKNPLKTYGQGILDTITACDSEAIIWDTDKKGRPDMVKLAYQAYKESGAECVCIISNRSTTAKVVYQLEARGIPAYGPILDS
ncbi:Non-ribosomal peptide synthetase [Fusarium acuminatum]|uniref:Non-ribosomal peptide synthetase n=1 Tax=Fusarium acuminatum TaxID=5515 RepID=A0ABZ2X1I0_9HYPO